MSFATQRPPGCSKGASPWARSHATLETPRRWLSASMGTIGRTTYGGRPKPLLAFLHQLQKNPRSDSGMQ